MKKPEDGSIDWMGIFMMMNRLTALSPEAGDDGQWISCLECLTVSIMIAGDENQRFLKRVWNKCHGYTATQHWVACWRGEERRGNKLHFDTKDTVSFTTS